eukprot:scaffold99054_cov33-Phaeocystis_antarctica.AAC.1
MSGVMLSRGLLSTVIKGRATRADDKKIRDSYGTPSNVVSSRSRAPRPLLLPLCGPPCASPADAPAAAAG